MMALDQEIQEILRDNGKIIARKEELYKKSDNLFAEKQKVPKKIMYWTAPEKKARSIKSLNNFMESLIPKDSDCSFNKAYVLNKTFVQLGSLYFPEEIGKEIESSKVIIENESILESLGKQDNIILEEDWKETPIYREIQIYPFPSMELAEAFKNRYEKKGSIILWRRQITKKQLKRGKLK